jgi:DNA repair protein RadC
MKNQETPAKNPHEGHRERLRERYDRSGMEDFAPHEVLELLLTYTIPRIDVHPLAHALIEKFGSVAGVLDATEQDLREIKGIGPKTARFLKMFPQVFRHYQLSGYSDKETYDTVAKLGDYLRTLYTGVTVERVYLLLLDNSLRIQDSIPLGEGSVNCSSVTVRTIAEHALRGNAAAVVLAHNHPRGLAIPSGADLEVTQTVECALETIGVPLLEHLIVTENSYAPILRHHKGLLRSSPKTGKIDKEFYRRFYGEN